MNIFLAGTPVTQIIPLVDRAGNLLTVDSVSYRVVDHNGMEVVASVPLTTFTSGDTSVAVMVPASVNNIVGVPASITGDQIDLYQVRETRTVELMLSIASNIVTLNSVYGLEPTDPLVVGINSFQTYAQAELCALDIPGMVAWPTAADVDKIAAMVDARSHIMQLNFWMMNNNTNWGQDSLNYIPQGSYTTPYASGGNNAFIFNGNLGLLTPSQYTALPIRFQRALAKAQVVEADNIMGGNPIEDRRIEGLMLESIGEVKQMFRASKPLDLPVSKRALRYLAQYVSFSKRIGRG